MRKLTYLITQGSELQKIEFITDRTPEWTVEQYTRHRNCTMELIGNEPTEETESKTKRI